MGRRAGMSTVQSSHGARISSSPSVAISSSRAKVSKPTSGRTKRKASVRTRQVRSSSTRLAARRAPGRRLAPHEAEVGEEVQRHLHRELRRGALEVLPALGHQRHAAGAGGRIGQTVRAVLDERNARAQAVGHDHVHGRASDGTRGRGVARMRGVDPEGLHRLLVECRSRMWSAAATAGRSLARAAQLGAVLGAVEPLRRPDAVHVVHELAAVEGPRGSKLS
jgi:hypothetical protein